VSRLNCPGTLEQGELEREGLVSPLVEQYGFWVRFIKSDHNGVINSAVGNKSCFIVQLGKSRKAIAGSKQIKCNRCIVLLLNNSMITYVARAILVFCFK
jgi:hypothetical protein